MAAYRIGDFVHVAQFGKGVVREVRNNGRYRVEINGRAMEASEAQLSAVGKAKVRVGARFADSRRGGSSDPPVGRNAEQDAGGIVTLDLHGHTVDEAIALLDAHLNDALLAGASALHVIHGKSGGTLKAAVHRRLREVPSVRRFSIDPRNSGQTLVVL